MSELLVRPAAPDEYAAAGKVTVDAYRHGGHLPDDQEDYAAWLADGSRRAAEGELVVAIDRGRVIGSVMWCPPGSRARELARHDDQGEFRSLGVDPAAQGRGVGRALVEHCLAEALRLDLREVLLSSMSTMTAAHGLYRSLGFIPRPELDWQPEPGVELRAFSLMLRAPGPSDSRLSRP